MADIIDNARPPTRDLATRGRAIAMVLSVGLVAACGAEDFPGAPGGAGDLNVPYVTTYNFGFTVGFTPLSGVNGNLLIISSSDLLNLVSAANITRRPATGVISGRALTTDQGISATNVVLAAMDVNGRPVGDFFYNSLGGTPDFVQTQGTTAAGGFTAFNVPPGEVYLSTLGGGRGGSRLVAFPDEVSLGTVMVTPVVVPIIGVLGEISGGAGQAITEPHHIEVGVVGQRLSEAVNCPDEIPTQDRVDGVFVELTAGDKTSFRFCVASDGDYFARLTGDTSVVPTYQTFNSDSSRLAALQTAELTEFFTIQDREGLDRAAAAAGTTWDPSKGVLAGQVQYGAGAARSAAVVRITDQNGREIAVPGGGDPNNGALIYLDPLGLPRTGTDAFSTSGNGRFIALNLPLPVGQRSDSVYVTVTAERPTAGVPERYAATSIAPIMAGAVTYDVINTVALLPPIQGDEGFAPYFTGPVSGRVMRVDGLAPVAGARITPFGVPLAELPTPRPNPDAPQLFTADADGRYEVLVNSDDRATTPLLQANTYLVRVEGPVGSSYLPTYQRITTGTAEFDTTTGLMKTQTQNLVAVPQSAINAYRTAVGQGDPVPGTGVLLGTMVDTKTNRPTAGVSIRLTAVDGSETSANPSGRSASIYYFDFGGVPRADLKATTPNGHFIVFNAPAGVVSLDVSSPDDTGNVLADSRVDGVTVVRIDVNNSPPDVVDVSGSVAPLVGSLPSGTLTVTAAGGDPMPVRRLCPDTAFERGGICYDSADPSQIVPKTIVPCTDEATYGKYRVLKEGYCQLQYTSTAATAPFTIPVGSLRDAVLKTSGDGLVDTYTFGVTIGSRPMNDVSLGAVTTTGLGSLAAAAGRALSPGSAVIFGQATTASLGEVDAQGNTVPLTCSQPVPWTTLPDNSTLACGALGTPGALVTGDFNDDSYRDLAIIDTSVSDPAVTIWLNTGDGGFVRSQRIVRRSTCAILDVGCGVEDGPVALLVVDYNGDGISDIVVLNQQSRSISLLEGRGAGQFVFGRSQVISDPGTEPDTLVGADFNLDRIPDLVITERISGRIILLLGNGAGFRAPPSTVQAPRVGNDPRAVLSGHLDFDGIPDLVFVNRDSISVMKGIGVSNTLTTYPVPSGSNADLSAAAIGDVDGNVFNDIVVADRSAGDPRVWVFLNGPFGLEAPTAIAAGAEPVAVALTDLNGDRSADLMVVHQSDGSLMYREGDGGGGFGPERVYRLGGQPRGLVMDDVTGDGAADAILSDPAPGASRVVILPHSTRPVDGVAVAAVRADGRAVGEVVYLDQQDRPMVGATLTGASGRFAILNVPTGPVWLRLLTGGLGSRLLYAYPDAVSNTKFPVVTGVNATTTVSGVTADAVLRPVGEVQIRFLGTQRATSSSPLEFDANGNTVGGASYAAVVEANSEYVVKLSK